MPVVPDAVTIDALADDLRDQVRGRVLSDPLARHLYATDASPFQLVPTLVVEPHDEADVQAVVRFAHAHSLSVTARGAGTGLAGESLNTGICLDFSVHFRSIVGLEADTIVVQPGVTYAEVQAALAPHGRRLAPDVAAGHCTIGGMLATNASGSNAARLGTTADWVQQLRVVWADGRCSTVGPPDAPPESELASKPAETQPSDEPVPSGPNEAELRLWLQDQAAILAQHSPRLPANRCGYAVQAAWDGHRIHWPRLLVGSEGTLGLITQATLRTIPQPGGVCQFVVGFVSLDAALQAWPDLQRMPSVVSADVLDQRLLAMARDHLPAGVGAALAVRLEAATEQAARADSQQLLHQLRVAHSIFTLFEPTCDPSELAKHQQFRTSAASGLYGVGHGRRPVPFVEDVAVPPELLSDFVAEIHDILRHESLTASFLVHLLSGVVHVRPLLDLANPEDQEAMWRVADQIHLLAIEFGGTISGQHGTGLARTPWVEKQFGPLFGTLREIKRVLDPHGILNPGKIVTLDPSRPAWPIRPPTKPTRTLLHLVPPVDAEAAKCNGCGDCRPRTGRVRMCPVFRHDGTEASTPRAKANLWRAISETEPITRDTASAIAALCVNCKMCQRECRASVNVPALVLEAKAQQFASNGFQHHRWLLVRAENLIRTWGEFAGTLNFLLARRSVRWLLEKLFGLSRQRRLPSITHRNYLRRAWWAGLTRRRRATAATRKVVYFVDHFATYHDPSLAEAAVAVLRHNGCEVVVPLGQRSSGMTPLVAGDADTARDLARANIRVLADYARDGFVIVCSEPSAAMALRHDYRLLLDDPDAELVAHHTRELMAFLGELHAAGELRPPTTPLPLVLGHHVPCHVKAAGPVHAPGLLELIPDLRVETVDESCSGMAGTWGLDVANEAAARTIAANMIAALDRPRILFGSTECSACRLQMQDTTGKRTLHPVQYLAWSYGLFPGLMGKLTRPLNPRLSS